MLNKPESTEDTYTAQYPVLFDNAPYPMAVYDILQGLYHFNKAFAAILNMKPLQIKPFLSYPLFTDENVANQMLDAIIVGDFWSDEVEIQKNDGDRFIVRLSAKPINFENGDTVALISLEQSFQENELLKKQKETHTQYLQTLQSVTLGMIRHLNLSNLLNLVIAKACHVTGVADGFIYLYDPTHSDMILTAAHGRYKPHIGFHILTGQGLVGEIMDSKEPIISGRDESHTEILNFNIYKTEYGVIGVPLISGSNSMG